MYIAVTRKDAILYNYICYLKLAYNSYLTWTLSSLKITSICALDNITAKVSNWEQ